MRTETGGINLDHDVIVVGAGFAGLYMLHRLRSAGYRVQAIEAAPEVGGTWYWNRYPGARCDVTSMEYSYSFSTELEQEWTWTERFATQPEILSYLNHVADRFDLRRDICFDTKVVKATFDDAADAWTVTTDQGDSWSARFCVMATGCLSTPKLPDIPGIDNFAGRYIHTADWPTDGVDFRGRKVGFIGTGSTGIQAIPMIARDAGHLHVFQRTPAYSVPARNRPLDPDDVRKFKANCRALRAWARETGAGRAINPGPPSALAATPDERAEAYEQWWKEGGGEFLYAYQDLMVNNEANETAAQFIRDKIHMIVEDQKVADALSPSYAVGAKRICVDTNYYATFNRHNVTLVDLRETPIERITPGGAIYGGKEHAFDDIVLGTGFDAMTGTLLAMNISGRDGLQLREKWAEGPRIHLGLIAAGFPNLFVITGPSSPSVLGNVVVAIEQHVDWVMECLDAMRARGATVIEPTPAAEDEWVDHVRTVGEQTLFAETESWYTGANVPGKPRVFMCYVGGYHTYRAKCDRIAAEGYPGFTFEGGTNPALARA